jgi:hypothetical protein
MGDHRRSSQSDHHGSLHEEVHTWLPEYAAAQALGQSTWARFPVVAAHLERCSICRAELEALLQLMIPAYSGEVVPAPGSPQFDLSFLQPHLPRPAETPRSRFSNGLRSLVIAFSEALIGPMQLPALAQAARGAMLYRYTPEPAPPGNLSITIDVFAGDDDPSLGNVQVLVDIPERDPFDQAGIHVTLHAGELVWQGVTGETGSVTFMVVPLHLLPHLRVEISLSPEP